MSAKMNAYEADMVNDLKKGRRAAFSGLFELYYRDMVLFCGNYIHDLAMCEDIVQNIFCKLWNDRESLNVTRSMKSYLLRCVRNSCIDEFRRRDTFNTYNSYSLKFNSADNIDTEKYILYSQLVDRLNNIMERMPDRTRRIFEMSRFHDLTHKNIAAELDISERTVEVHMKKAMDIMKIKLSDILDGCDITI